MTLTPGRAAGGFSVIDGDRSAPAAGGVGELALPALADGDIVDGGGVGVPLLDVDAAPADEVVVAVGLGLGPPIPPEMLVGVGVEAVVLRLVGVPVGRDVAGDVAVA